MTTSFNNPLAWLPHHGRSVESGALDGGFLSCLQHADSVAGLVHSDTPLHLVNMATLLTRMSFIFGKLCLVTTLIMES